MRSNCVSPSRCRKGYSTIAKLSVDGDSDSDSRSMVNLGCSSLESSPRGNRQIRQLSKPNSFSRSNSPSPSPTSKSCPFVPSLPHAGSQRLAAAAARSNDYTQLHAALSSEGVRLGQQQQQRTGSILQQNGTSLPLNSTSILQHSSSLQQLRAERATPASIGSSGSQLDFGKLAAELQERAARISSLQTKQEQIDAQRSARPSVTQALLSAVPSRPGSSLDMNSSTAAGTGRAAGSIESAAAQMTAQASYLDKTTSPDIVPVLQAQLAVFEGNLNKLRAASVAAAAGVSTAGPAVPFSSHSSTEQPLTPALTAQSQPQLQGFLALNSSNSSSNQAAVAAADVGLSAASLQQQQQQHLAAAKQFAQAGLQQLQEVTHMSQQLRPVVASMSGAAADVKQKLLDLDAFFRQHPEYQSAAALRHLVEANKQLKQEVYAKQQALTAALNALREQTHTPSDKRTTALQQEVQMLKDQLLARDAALAACEEDNRRLRDQLGLPPASCGSSDLSPCKGEGEVYGSTASSPTISRRLWVDSDDGGCMNSSTASIASSRSNSSRSLAMGASGQGQANSNAMQLLQPQQQRSGELRQLAATYQAALASKEQEVQQLQQQVEELQKQVQAQHEGVTQPARAGSPPIMQHLSRQLSTKPRTMDEALQQLATLRDIVSRLQQQMEEQDRQATSRAAEREVAFKRQLNVEKQQHEHTRQNCKLLEEQLASMQQRLTASQSQVLQLQQQLERATDELHEMQAVADAAAAGSLAAEPSAPGSARSCTSQVEHMQRLQQHVQAQKGVIQQLQDCLQGLHARIKSAGRLVAPAGRRQQQQQLKPGGSGSSNSFSLLTAQLDASVQQLLKDVANHSLQEQRQQGVGQAPQPAELQALQEQVSKLQKCKQQLEEEVEALKAENASYEPEVLAAQQHLRDCEERLLQFTELAERNKQLQQDKNKLQQERRQLQQDQRNLQQGLAEARGQLDRALEGQQASAAHLEECRQQLALAQAERALLVDRIRELADRASAAEMAAATASAAGAAGAAAVGVDGRGNPSPTGAEVQQRLSAACAELNQQVAGLRRQLTESQLKEEKLQVANAQLQERITALQVLHPEHHKQQQGLLEQQVQQQAQQIQLLQQQLEQQQQRVQDLQQQLQQVDQQHQNMEDLQQQLQRERKAVQRLQQQLQQERQQLQELQQRQQQQAGTSSELEAEVQKLRAELEDRTQELDEWQIHADALEKDLADLKERADAADSLQDQLEQQRQEAHMRADEARQLQAELTRCKNRVAHLEFDLHDAAKDHTALLSRFEAVSAELGRVKEGAADMRLRLEHFTGPAGPQARIRQLEASLQSLQRKYEAADGRAASAAAEIEGLSQKLASAEDEIMALEGQVSILEQELAKYTQ